MLFSKSINTKKTNPLDVMRETISAAIDTARKNGVSVETIFAHLDSVVGGLRIAAHVAAEQRVYNPNPVMYDALTMQPIDAHGAAAKREEERAARELR
jgi:hypothetical protein